MPSNLERFNTQHLMTTRNVIISSVVAGLGSLLLLWLFRAMNPLALLPFCAYGLLQTALIAYTLVRRPSSFTSFITMRAGIDILLTLYWIDLHTHASGRTTYFLLPVLLLSLIAYYRIRLDRRRIRATFIAIYTLVILNGAAFSLITGVKVSFVEQFIYLFMAAHSIWATFLNDRLIRKYSESIDSSEHRIDQLVHQSRTIEVTAAIVRHDIANCILPLAQIARKLNDDAPDLKREQSRIKAIAERIGDKIGILEQRRMVRIDLGVFLQRVLHPSPIDNQVSGRVRVRYPFQLLVSFVQNIHDNALQAYARRHGSLEGFHFSMHFVAGTLCFDDNSGGFELNAIRLGRSAKKGAGHGIFLATFLTDCGEFGMKPSIEDIDGGTRVVMKFSEWEEKTD